MYIPSEAGSFLAFRMRFSLRGTHQYLRLAWELPQHHGEAYRLASMILHLTQFDHLTCTRLFLVYGPSCPTIGPAFLRLRLLTHSNPTDFRRTHLISPPYLVLPPFLGGSKTLTLGSMKKGLQALPLQVQRMRIEKYSSGHHCGPSVLRYTR